MTGQAVGGRMKPAQKKLGALAILYVLGIVCVMTIATALLS